VLSAVVKSNAYGMGLDAIVGLLADAGCRDFWAGDLEEARSVRALAPNAAVYALMGLGGAHIRDFEAAGVVPALASLSEVEHCARHGMVGGRRVAVAIQIDTGLGRLGLCGEDLAFLAGQAAMMDHLDIRLWVTHLAAYNLPDDPENAEQRGRLLGWLRPLPSAPISLVASAGVFMPGGWHFDMARVGSALFGEQTSILWQDGLVPCYELSAPILRVADYPAGRRLGYRGVTVLERPSRVATVAIGYANGLPQRFAEVAAARVAGVETPVVGGIAMNLTMLDVTDVPPAALTDGARAVFLGPDQPFEPLAEALGCTPNALLTQIGAGTRKRYVGG
jgi:alanine racemase